MAVSFIGGRNRSPWENHRPVVWFNPSWDRIHDLPHSNMLTITPSIQFDYQGAEEEMFYLIWRKILNFHVQEIILLLCLLIKCSCSEETVKQLLNYYFDFSIDICFPFAVPVGDKRFPSGCKNFIRASKATKDVNLPGMTIWSWVMFAVRAIGNLGAYYGL